jgi:hypothetical protein
MEHEATIRELQTSLMRMTERCDTLTRTVHDLQEILVERRDENIRFQKRIAIVERQLLNWRNAAMTWQGHHLGMNHAAEAHKAVLAAQEGDKNAYETNKQIPRD